MQLLCGFRACALQEKLMKHVRYWAANSMSELTCVSSLAKAHLEMRLWKVQDSGFSVVVLRQMSAGRRFCHELAENI
jgi:hypothetical protein